MEHECKRTTTLAHEVRDHTVEDGALVAESLGASAQLAEVLRRPRAVDATVKTRQTAQGQTGRGIQQIVSNQARMSGPVTHGEGPRRTAVCASASVSAPAEDV